MSPYELFDHTADLGLRATGRDLESLLCAAAEGLFAILVEPAVNESRGERLELPRIEGTRPDWLLFDWLSELLFVFESRRLLLSGFEVRLDARGLRAASRARPIGERDRLLHEVKAITYHGLRVERTADGFEAEVIVDI
jgi:SHS2 domain-containing protein